jgi:hypothetical protein
MDELAIAHSGPPSPEASRLDSLRALWQGAGLADLETETFEVRREYESFDRYWDIVCTGPRVATTVAGLSDPDRTRLRETLRRRVPADGTGRVVRTARANAIKGRLADR